MDEFDAARWRRAGATDGELTFLQEAFDGMGEQERIAENESMAAQSDGMLADRLAALREEGFFPNDPPVVQGEDGVKTDAAGRSTRGAARGGDANPPDAQSAS